MPQGQKFEFGALILITQHSWVAQNVAIGIKSGGSGFEQVGGLGSRHGVGGGYSGEYNMGLNKHLFPSYQLITLEFGPRTLVVQLNLKCYIYES